MFQDSLDQQVSIPEEDLNVPEDPTPALDDDDHPLPTDYALLGFWSAPLSTSAFWQRLRLWRNAKGSPSKSSR